MKPTWKNCISCNSSSSRWGSGPFFPLPGEAGSRETNDEKRNSQDDLYPSRYQTKTPINGKIVRIYTCINLTKKTKLPSHCQQQFLSLWTDLQLLELTCHKSLDQDLPLCKKKYVMFYDFIIICHVKKKTDITHKYLPSIV